MRLDLLFIVVTVMIWYGIWNLLDLGIKEGDVYNKRKRAVIVLSIGLVIFIYMYSRWSEVVLAKSLAIL